MKKLVNEVRKILELSDLALSPTTVRVPVFTTHAIAVNAELEQHVSPDRARALFQEAFTEELVAGVESFTGHHQKQWHSLPEPERQAWLDLVDATAATPEGLGAAEHLLFIGRKRPGALMLTGTKCHHRNRRCLHGTLTHLLLPHEGVQSTVVLLAR